MKSDNLVLLVIAGLLLYFMYRDTENGGGGGGGGGDGTAVTAQGVVGAIDVSQAQDVVMSAARVDKAPGQNISVAITYSGVGAITALNQRVTWPVRMVTRIGHTTGVGGLGGWKEGQELGITEFTRRYNTIVTSTSQPVAGTLTQLLTTPNDVGQEWDIHVLLEAQRSDQFGDPVPDTWDVISSEVKLDGAINIVGGATQLFGSVGTIDVSQDLAMARSNGRYLYRPLYR